MNDRRSAISRMELRDAVLCSICLAVVLVYWSLLGAPALTWDDGVNIFENPHLLNGQLRALWRDAYFGLYVPVINTVWAGLLSLGHGAAWPFRVLNLTLHLVNVVLFAQLLRGLLRRFALDSDIAVALGVACFALHPMQTAAVAWISGSRDLAATACALAAIRLYFASARGASWWALLLFAAGLLCKPQIAGVPLAIVFYVWRFEPVRLRRTIAEMAVWAMLVLASAVITLIAQTDASTVQVPPLQRPLFALDALGFYALKTMWPYPLAADYGRIPGVLWSHPGRMIGTVATIVAMAIVWWQARARSRVYEIALVWPLLLLPVLGLVTFGYQQISTVADHYNYLPMTAVALLVSIAVAGTRWASHRSAWVVVAIVVVIASAASWQRTRVWHSDDRFYADMLAKNPDSFSAQINLSAAHCDRGEWSEGLALLAQSASQASADPGYLANSAYCLFQAERWDDVLRLQDRLQIATVRVGLERKPRAAAAFANAIAGAFDRQGIRMGAFAYLCQSDAVLPGDAEVRHAIEEIRGEFAARGQALGCPGLLPWEMLARVGAELR